MQTRLIVAQKNQSIPNDKFLGCFYCCEGTLWPESTVQQRPVVETGHDHAGGQDPFTRTVSAPKREQDIPLARALAVLSGMREPNVVVSHSEICSSVEKIFSDVCRTTSYEIIFRRAV